MAISGSVNIRTRPIKIAFLVDPNDGNQAREAIRLSSTIWGGSYCPIVTLYKKMPTTWKEGALKAPKAESVVLGYIEAFDPDVLVQFSKSVPDYIKDLKLPIIKPGDVWKMEQDDRLTPRYGIGVFEIFNDIFEKNFKYKAKYPVKVVIPKLPKDYSLFWASFFGEFPDKHKVVIKKDFSEPLEIEEFDFKPEAIEEVVKRGVIFPRRATQHVLNQFNNAGPFRDAYAFFMDASKTEDVIDFWNLRAMGRNVMPIPKQFISNKKIQNVIINFFKANRRHWKHNNKVCNYASIVRSRNSTMDEMKEYVKTINLSPSP